MRGGQRARSYSCIHLISRVQSHTCNGPKASTRVCRRWGDSGQVGQRVQGGRAGGQTRGQPPPAAAWQSQKLWLGSPWPFGRDLLAGRVWGMAVVPAGPQAAAAGGRLTWGAPEHRTRSSWPEELRLLEKQIFVCLPPQAGVQPQAEKACSSKVCYSDTAGFVPSPWSHLPEFSGFFQLLSPASPGAVRQQGASPACPSPRRAVPKGKWPPVAAEGHKLLTFRA